MEELLSSIIDDCKKYTKQGEVARYIPELAKANPDHLGIYIEQCDGTSYCAGDYDVKFTIQSISKVIILLCAYLDSPIEKIKKTVSLEPTSDGFNSIVNLEAKNSNKPLNPLINSGAIATLSLVESGSYNSRHERILAMTKKLTENENIIINENVYLSEKKTGDRNRALAYFMKSTGIIAADLEIENLLDDYFKICSMEITCKELAKIALVLVNNGIIRSTGEEVFPKRLAKIAKATLSLCGMYNESGIFAVRVGLPSKSGVGGGILSVVPEKMGIGVFGPALSEKGSSIAGMKVLEKLSKQLDLSIY